MSDVVTFTNSQVPTKSELKARANVLVQLFRFVSLNIRMLKMISKGHH
jgi:hypothetical protein